MAMKRCDLRSGTNSTSYSPFDPELKIAGKGIRFIVNIALDPSLQYDHFKELGRFISVNLKETKIKFEIRVRTWKRLSLLVLTVSANSFYTNILSSLVSHGLSLSMISV